MLVKILSMSCLFIRIPVLVDQKPSGNYDGSGLEPLQANALGRPRPLLNGAEVALGVA